MTLSRIIALLGVLILPLATGACDLTRAEARACPTFPGPTFRGATFPGPSLTAKSTQGPDGADAMEATAQMVARTGADIEAAIRAEVARAPTRRTVTFEVITLSAGGQYGAFGA
ncbi:MAG: hypothetical protein WBA67_16660, partial [Jannaschia sp.]